MLSLALFGTTGERFVARLYRQSSDLSLQRQLLTRPPMAKQLAVSYLKAPLKSCRPLRTRLHSLNRGFGRQGMASGVDGLMTRLSSLNITDSPLASRPFIEGVTLNRPVDDSYLPVAYLHTLCPYAQRVWLAFLEKEADFQPVQIDLSDKPSFYRSICSATLVPAVSHRGHIIIESLDICRWIDSRLDGPDLVPSDEKRAMEMDRLVSSAASINSAGLDLLAGGTGRHWGIGRDQTGAQRRAFECQLSKLELALQSSGGPFLLGQQLTLADIVIFPFLERFALAMPEHASFDPKSVLGGSIGGWLSAMAERPSCKTASADAALLQAAFREHRSLDFFDYTTYPASTLHPHIAGEGRD